MENVKNETIGNVINFDGLFDKLKSNLIYSLGYTETNAAEQAERIATIFNNAYSDNNV